MEGSLRLIVEKGPKRGEKIDSKAGSSSSSVIKIGRVMKGNTFAIRDTGISSNHLVIEFKRNKWVMSDLGSSNGTMLNEERITAFTDVDLKDEDIIKIGERTSLRVKIVIEEEKEEKEEEQLTVRRNPKRRAAPKNFIVSSSRIGRRGCKEETVDHPVLASQKIEKCTFDDVWEVQKSLARLNIAQNEGLQKCEEEVKFAPVVKKKRTQRAGKKNGKATEDVQTPDLEEDTSNPKEEICQENASTSAGDTGAKEEKRVDFEKMTLGEWFDYMEVYVVKQLRAKRDENIASMRETSRRFHEFMLEQQKLKDGKK